MNHDMTIGHDLRVGNKRLAIHLRCLTKSIVNLVKTFEMVKLELLPSIQQINQADGPTPYPCLLHDPVTPADHGTQIYGWGQVFLKTNRRHVFFFFHRTTQKLEQTVYHTKREKCGDRI